MDRAPSGQHRARTRLQEAPSRQTVRRVSMRDSTIRSRAAVFAALLAVAACRPQPSAAPAPAPTAIVEPRDATRVAQAAADAAFPSGWRFPTGVKPTESEHAMVVSNSQLASEAGIEVLKAGG